MIVTALVRDDDGAKHELQARGLVIPPLPFAGWRVVACKTGETRGAVILSASADGEDYELLADGGWTVPGARTLFEALFVTRGERRLSARVPATNVRNIRVLKRMGFQEEGRKRLADGDVVLLGMLRSECRLLKGMEDDGHLQVPETA